jgi:hypothetical protein
VNQAPLAVVMEPYLHGVSRRARSMTWSRPLDADIGISRTDLSRMGVARRSREVGLTWRGELIGRIWFLEVGVTPQLAWNLQGQRSQPRKEDS